MQEVKIRITDDAYVTVQELGSTEVFLSDLVVNSKISDADTYDHLFTPERLAIIDAAAAEAETGQGITVEQMREIFKEKRRAWQENHPA
jgi:hypothetical protein